MRPQTQTVTRLDYCQYLLVSQSNYTLTNFAEHSEKFSHDALNRYVAGERLPPKLIWEAVKNQAVQTPNGFLVFDDTVADKNYSHEIELVRRQYSGNAHGVIKGIGIVTCVYVNPDTDQKGRRIAEISSLCVCDTYKNDHRTLLFGLLKFLYEYSVSFFGIDIKLIVIKPFRRHFYESMLNFEILENRNVHNYEFSNGATVMTEYLDLSQAPEKYKQIYNSHPNEKNLYKYFIETKIDNFHFPDRTYYSISDPKLTPELLHYFFVEKTNTLQNLTQEELTIIKSQYKESEYQNIFAGFTNNVLTLNFFRTEGRFEV